MSDASGAACPASVARVGPLLTVFFRPAAPLEASEALDADREAYARFFGSMLDQGILLPPSPFEAWFLSAAHDDEAISRIAAALPGAARAAAIGLA